MTDRLVHLRAAYTNLVFYSCRCMVCGHDCRGERRVTCRFELDCRVAEKTQPQRNQIDPRRGNDFCVCVFDRLCSCLGGRDCRHHCCHVEKQGGLLTLNLLHLPTQLLSS